MSISIFSTDSDQFNVTITWLDGLTPRTMTRLMSHRTVLGFIHCCPGAWVTYN
jgi:hypothetical protein